MRRHFNSPSGCFVSPSTIHTSPIQVQTAARSPSAKKSKPPSRIQLCHGFAALSGWVMMSVANGPSSDPLTPCVVTTCGQRGGPP